MMGRRKVYGYVYGVGCGRTLVKIGMANDVAERMKCLAAANPFLMTLRYCLRVPSHMMVDLEKWMHARLAKQRLYKEWFSAQPETYAKAFSDALDVFEYASFEHRLIGMREPKYTPNQPASCWGRQPLWKDEKKLIGAIADEQVSVLISAALSL
jgi:hypothetical protein